MHTLQVAAPWTRDLFSLKDRSSFWTLKDLLDKISAVLDSDKLLSPPPLGSSSSPAAMMSSSKYCLIEQELIIFFCLLNFCTQECRALQLKSTKNYSFKCRVPPPSALSLGCGSRGSRQSGGPKDKQPRVQDQV